MYRGPPVCRDRTVHARIAGAALRGIMVALLVATPSLLLPSYTSDATEMVALLALLAGVLTFAEYNTAFPSFIEFRDAPPLNRIRFVSLFAMFLILTEIARHTYEPTSLNRTLAGIGVMIGAWTDFPYSPVRLAVLMLPPSSADFTVTAVRTAAGVTYMISIATILAFVAAVKVFGWPISRGPFNVWTNLPLFDPTAGGDVVERLQRDGKINIIAGFLLPFAIPAIIKIVSLVVRPITLDDPQTVIWVMSGWAFLPASMIMRGIAMMRIGDLIEEKRRRVHASAEAMQTT